MDYYNKLELEKRYGTPYITQKAEGYYPLEKSKDNKNSKMNFIIDSAVFYFKERLSIDGVIKELTFAFIALTTYVFMQRSGHIKLLDGFGNLIGFLLVTASLYNLYKASFKSLAPGLFCLIGGFVLLETTRLHSLFGFLTKEIIEYIIGIGALFVALSLFKSNNY